MIGSLLIVMGGMEILEVKPKEWLHPRCSTPGIWSTGESGNVGEIAMFEMSSWRHDGAALFSS